MCTVGSIICITFEFTNKTFLFLKATAFPIAIYGCESWAMTSGDKKRVDAFEMWCYRRLLRVSWTERKTNKWVLEKIGSVLMLRKSMP